MKKLLLVLIAIMLCAFVTSCGGDDTDNKIDQVKTTDPANNMTTIVNDNLANDEFSPRY